MHDVSVSRMPYAKKYWISAQGTVGGKAAGPTGDNAFGGAPASPADER